MHCEFILCKGLRQMFGGPDNSCRSLLELRDLLNWTEIKNRLLALLNRRNLQPNSSRWLTVRGRRELEDLPLGAIPSRSGRTA
jgi:hypothetical protein